MNCKPCYCATWPLNYPLKHSKTTWLKIWGGMILLTYKRPKYNSNYIKHQHHHNCHFPSNTLKCNWMLKMNLMLQFSAHTNKIAPVEHASFWSRLHFISPSLSCSSEVFVGDEKRLSSLKLIFYSCSSPYLCSSAFSGVKKEVDRERKSDLYL